MNTLAFSTLACPDWSIETILEKAVACGFEGIEWRGGPEGHLQPNLLATRRATLRIQCLDAGLLSLAITAYTSFVSDSARERQGNLDELRRYTDLAADIGARYVRVFAGELSVGQEVNGKMYARIAESLYQAVEYASPRGVILALEPHDDFVRSSTILPILEQVRHPALRVIWDLGNTFRAGEDPEEALALLQPHLAYVQVKDGRGRGEDWQLCPLGEGDVPLERAFALLRKHDYPGALSFEWEYAWHPELDPPEVALPSALETMRELWTAAEMESA
jgi:sugar phosphate isomerase/epimerase